MTGSRSRWLVALVLGSTILAPATYALANADTQAHASKFKHGGLKERLGLTDDQATQIRAIYKEQGTRGRELGKTVRQLQTEIRQMALSGADDATLRVKMDELEKGLAQGVAMRVDTLRKIGPLLTDEQRQKLAQMGEGHHHRGHRRGGPARQS